MPPFRQNVKASTKWWLLAGSATALAGMAWSSLPLAAALGLGQLMQFMGLSGLLLASLAAAMARHSTQPGPVPDNAFALRLTVRLVAVFYLFSHLYAFSRLAALWTLGGACLAVWGLWLGRPQAGPRHGGAL